MFFPLFSKDFLLPCQTERSQVQSGTTACIRVLPELVYLAKYVREAKLFKWNAATGLPQLPSENQLTHEHTYTCICILYTVKLHIVL